MPEELAETAEVVARARGISVNTLMLDALQAEVDRVRQDEDFMGRLHRLVERDKEILDRLADGGELGPRRTGGFTSALPVEAQALVRDWLDDGGYERALEQIALQDPDLANQ